MVITLGLNVGKKRKKSKKKSNPHTPWLGYHFNKSRWCAHPFFVPSHACGNLDYRHVHLSLLLQSASISIQISHCHALSYFCYFTKLS
jgi:hypothetical protein